MKKSQKRNKPILSIIIVSYNTREVLRACLDSLENIRNFNFEIIVSDNGSVDGSVEMIKERFKKIKLIENGENLGFAKGNNAAREFAKGKYILFLNSDTIVNEEAIEKSLDYIDSHKEVGSLTCKLVLQNGNLDPDTIRAFPTPFPALSHFSGLDRLFSSSYIFAKYWYGYLDKTKTQEVDVIQGAFHLTRREILDKVGWFDEDYFLDGEDIDLCWKIKNLGYKIMYYPEVSIIHIKKASKKNSKSSLRVTSGMRAMEIFYKKNLWKNYPFYINYLIILGIKFLTIIRLIKFYLK